jgi:hypothetical protein
MFIRHNEINIVKDACIGFIWGVIYLALIKSELRISLNGIAASCKNSVSQTQCFKKFKIYSPEFLKNVRFNVSNT